MSEKKTRSWNDQFVRMSSHSHKLLSALADKGEDGYNLIKIIAGGLMPNIQIIPLIDKNKHNKRKVVEIVGVYQIEEDVFVWYKDIAGYSYVVKTVRSKINDRFIDSLIFGTGEEAVIYIPIKIFGFYVIGYYSNKEYYLQIQKIDEYGGGSKSYFREKNLHDLQNTKLHMSNFIYSAMIQCFEQEIKKYISNVSFTDSDSWTKPMSDNKRHICIDMDEVEPHKGFPQTKCYVFIDNEELFALFV